MWLFWKFDKATDYKKIPEKTIRRIPEKNLKDLKKKKKDNRWIECKNNGASI